MLDAAEGADFAAEAGVGLGVAGLRLHLERDFAIEGRLKGAVDHAHGSAAEFAHDLVLADATNHSFRAGSVSDRCIVEVTDR